MKIGVIGGGVVGQATARSYLEFHEVRVFDVVPERRTHSLLDVLACDLVFVCLPTPQKVGLLECDVSAIYSFFADHAGYKTNFVLRSTVPIGTTRRLHEQYDLPNIVHSPEFLTARCAVTDAQIPARNVIGTTGRIDIHSCGVTLGILYKDRFPGTPIYRMSSSESEAVKLFQNGFFAVKVAYFNEVRMLADELRLDWQAILDAVLADGRIAHSHTKVPGPDGKFGFGGECLPKDLVNLISCLHGMGAITSAAKMRNDEDRKRRC